MSQTVDWREHASISVTLLGWRVGTDSCVIHP